MRRCPECDFIYEDDEQLCAMDGTGLVGHSGPLPFEKNALPRSVTAAHSHGSGLTLIAAGLILAIALLLYFYDVAKRKVFQSNSQGTAKTYSPLRPGVQNPVAVVPVETATPLTTPSPAFDPTPAKTEAPNRIYRARQHNGNDPFRAAPTETGTPLPRSMPSSIPIRPKIDVPLDNPVYSPVKPSLPPSESRPPATPDTQVKPTDTNKRESKITTFLKKAGRILKKPFKQ